ncbi:hypothetical protein [Paenibacillus methanolicus]|uniref:hypothetical protein n=1 Tax=Paenibacillus methanolicus TaxID=582686 RepID=UPI0011E7238A|nr:hypothetical protein [Paenibacillus methanolicus]
MTKRIVITDWEIEVDYSKTKEYYSNHKIDDDCTCTSCMNYRFNCKQFSNELLEFFEGLGIDPSKEGEFMDFGVSKEGSVIYMGFYHLVGRILDGPDYVDDKWEELNLFKINEFEFGFSSLELRCVPDDFPDPVIQLEFKAILPWLLEVPRE